MKARRLILIHIPNKKCNLKCKYCYLSQVNEWDVPREERKYSVEHIAKSLRKERLGGPCLINLTGDGETMLEPQIVYLCKLLLEEGHYIELVTNGTITRIVNEFMELPSTLLKHLEFKISYHYLELKEKNMTDQFWRNVERIQSSNCSFTLELMPNDQIVEYIDDIVKTCNEKVGALCHLTVGRADYCSTRDLLTEYTNEEYARIWSVFKSQMFDLKMKLLGVKRKEFCYAGDWTLYVNLYSGDASPCYAQPLDQNIFEFPDKPIIFQAVGCHCREPYCINGHAHISMGIIPEFNSPTYEQVRNRVRIDGTEWFNHDCKDFFSTKLCESNDEYCLSKKALNYIGWYFKIIVFITRNPIVIKNRIKKILGFGKSNVKRK